MSKKRLIIMLMTITVFLVLTTAGFALANPNWQVKNFQGMLKNIKIIVNNQLLNSSVEPFILIEEGVTMVPLRDISEALGFKVGWDSTTNTITIEDLELSGGFGDTSSSIVRHKIEEMKVIRNVGPFYQKTQGYFQSAGRTFSSGIAVKLGSSQSSAEVVIDLNQQYESLAGYFGIEDQTMNSSSGYRLSIYGDDLLLFASDVIKPSEYPRYFEDGDLDLTYINRLIIKVEISNAVGQGDYSDVIPVLADVYFSLREDVRILPVAAQGEDYRQVRTIIVSKGDTLFSIAQKYNTTVDRLLQLNPEIDAYSKTIKIGQEIRLP